MIRQTIFCFALLTVFLGSTLIPVLKIERHCIVFTFSLSLSLSLALSRSLAFFLSLSLSLSSASTLLQSISHFYYSLSYS
jgi:hypothetical protein